ncbi:FIST C-terminal domain-containing protein [Propionivibrio sp.]|uniref:FIST C-terminal domain-containing protein n=1 Tax=Propionivibrio sp. TaxID=2212460 RepID=UPI0025F84016|nr:FIST C-terminal domain-containing protein [Propionivibrio sp.]MBK7356910.1 FIST C-terminal domain-containing protein [Propionivibrio sp.]
MTVATALVSDNDALPRLAEDAVRQALERAGATHANGVLLFLTPEFARHAQQTITAVARVAQCTQVAGGIASGIFTESGWALDRPAAAVMVLGGDLSLGHAEVGQHPVLSYAGGNFPPEWGNDGVRFGGCFSGSTGCADALVWQQCRLTEPQRCSTQLLGATLDIAVSSGLKLLGKALPVDSSKGFDVEQIGGQTALKSLNRMLPTHLRNHAGLLHHVNAVLFENEGQANTALADGHFRPIAIVTANADNSLTLAERVVPGQFLAWAIRQPDGAMADMRQTVERLAKKLEGSAQPRCALMFSCIGRGPYFYGGEDGDLDVFRERFPVLPVLGTYGTGQIAPSTAVSGDSVNRLMQNAVVTALVSTRVKEEHVQPIA